MRRTLTQALPLIALFSLLIRPSIAEVERVYRSVRALSDKELQISVFGRVNTKDCKPLPLPGIRVISAPEHGSLTVRVVTLTTNQYPGCPALRLPAQVLLYKSVLNYEGNDQVSFAVTFENGQMQMHQITIVVVKEGEPSKSEDL